MQMEEPELSRLPWTAIAVTLVGFALLYGAHWTKRSLAKSNLVKLTHEQWQARKHRKMFRVIPA
jgi:hypothetical protein